MAFRADVSMRATDPRRASRSKGLMTGTGARSYLAAMMRFAALAPAPIAPLKPPAPA